MYSRDYVYVRRYDVDVEKNLMVLVSRCILSADLHTSRWQCHNRLPQINRVFLSL